jgi:thiosulfate dehydrogenase
MENSDKQTDIYISIIRKLNNLVIFLLLILILLPIVFLNLDTISNFFKEDEAKVVPYTEEKKAVVINDDTFWTPRDLEYVTNDKKLDKILYGKDLIEHTSKYFGPKGSINSISNGLNCQNCHLSSGTKVFGNNYGSVASTYPKLRARSGEIESMKKRINDCFERSLNGKAINESGKEMEAIVAYMNHLGKNVPKGKKAEGSGLKEMAFINRAANPDQGKLVYDAKCASCHAPNGEGIPNQDGTEFTYPPLWGANSFNDAAGLYRISNMAKFVKYNMPFGVSHDSPQLTDEESWDVASYIISQPRPHKNVPKDWPDISKKPIDHPFGPYVDKFSEKEHKFGPFTKMKVKK